MIGNHFFEKDTPGMNVELLRKIQEHNTAHPEQLDMSDWFGSSKCGTVACIAGLACLIEGFSPSIEDCRRVAIDLLEFESRDQATRLFYAGDWPRRFQPHVVDAIPGTPEYAALVNARIDHFIATGGAE